MAPSPAPSTDLVVGQSVGTETKLTGWGQRQSWIKLCHVLNRTTNASGALQMLGQWHRISGPWPFSSACADKAGLLSQQDRADHLSQMRLRISTPIHLTTTPHVWVPDMLFSWLWKSPISTGHTSYSGCQHCPSTIFLWSYPSSSYFTTLGLSSAFWLYYVKHVKSHVNVHGYRILKMEICCFFLHCQWLSLSTILPSLSLTLLFLPPFTPSMWVSLPKVCLLFCQLLCYFLLPLLLLVASVLGC